MAHKSDGRGTYLVDRIFPGVGRIRRATGTKDTTMAGALNDMLSGLWAHGRLDILAAIRDGELHLMEAFTKVREYGIPNLPKPDEVAPLTVLRDWATKYRGSPKHVASVQNGIEHILKAAHPNTTIGEVATVLRTYRESASPSMFRHVRAYLQGLLKVNLGQRHRLYLAVGDVPLIKHTPKPRDPLTKQEMVDLDLPQPLYGMAWSMALTSMGTGEYWGKWEVLEDRILVHGTKTASRDRIVPRVEEIIRPATTVRFFQTAFRDATKKKHSPYALRHTFERWAEEAGIPPSRADAYMGHEPRTVKQRYRWHEVEPYLADDATRLREYLADAKSVRMLGS